MVGIFIDLSKVFDTVVSTTFKKKLELHTVQQATFSMISKEPIRQKKICKSSKTKLKIWKKMNCVVLQHFVLGLLLFLLTILKKIYYVS